MTDQEKKHSSPHAVIEETGLAFDPSTQHLDLSKYEKRRTTALLLAIQAYGNLIIKDAEMYRELKGEERRGDGPKIQPGTISAMVSAAIEFDDFIAGRFEASMDEAEDKGQSDEGHSA
jgi:hypothetical protein